MSNPTGESSDAALRPDFDRRVPQGAAGSASEVGRVETDGYPGKRTEMSATQPRWCLFTSAGDRNGIRRWISADRPSRWDLVIGYYGDSDQEFAALAQHASFAFRDKGGKFQILKTLVTRQPHFFDQYDYVWVGDDDIDMSPAQIEESFAIAERFEFWIAQPAFTNNSRMVYRIGRSRWPAAISASSIMSKWGCQSFAATSSTPFSRSMTGP